MRIQPLLLTSLVAAAPAWSATHDDDPKAIRTVAPYAGPGWSRGGLQRLAGPLGNASGPFAASGIQLLAWMSTSDLGMTPGRGANDCWGYVSPSGREYAVLCTEESTIFVDVNDPFSPSVVGTIPGPVGTWRDAKIYQEYAYVVCETGCQGIQVIDLTQIDAGTVSLLTTVNLSGTGSTHNVVINEESGYLYRSGGGSTGLRFYSLANPTSPTFVGAWNDRYVHDAQVVTYTSGPLAGKEIAYCCSGFNGGWTSPGLTVVDVTNKANPVVISQVDYPGAVYSHQGWLTEDRQYFLLGDELDEGNLGISSTIHIIDVGDPFNAQYVSAFDNGNPAITHNGYVRGDFLYQANYTSGMRVFDVSNPLAAVEVAWLDSYPANDAVVYEGLWSTYPFLPSGIVLGSDRQSGLLIMWHGEERVGDTYCSPNSLNSTGLPGRLAATGSDVANQNDLTLTGTSLPNNQFGFFLASLSTAAVANPGGSQGTLCLGQPIARFNAQVLNTGTSGSMSAQINLTAIPANPVTAVMPGQTWNFQGWYRDGGTSNFTDAVSISFQ